MPVSVTPETVVAERICLCRMPGTMNNFPFVPAFVVLLAMLVQLAWHVAVIVFLYKIWQKVRHLPSA